MARLLRITKVFRLIGLRRLTRQGGALHSLGWFTTQDKGSACDGNGNPIPWISYPAISFLDGRVNPALEVFEFGSGKRDGFAVSGDVTKHNLFRRSFDQKTGPRRTIGQFDGDRFISLRDHF